MKKFILIVIILLAAFLRLYKLSSYPAFNADEAAIGYNAYSLIKTGNDEHGNPWPIHFQSFNDFKPGGYFYMVLPFVKVLGLNEMSVRLPGALLGILTVYILYLLVREMKFGSGVDLLAPFLLAISPWHIHFSRGGWEVNAATFLITTSVLIFLKGIKKNSHFIFYVIFSVIALYTYHSARIIVPLLGVGLVLIYRKDIFIKRNVQVFLTSLVVLILTLIPLTKDLLKSEAVSRAAGVGLFADPGPISRIEEQRTEHGDFTSLPAKLFHNKLTNYGLAFVENWAEHYHGLFLFLSGDDIQRDKVPETGVAYLSDLFFILIGLLVIIKNPSKGYKLVICWLVIAPIAASLTFQSPHALRSANMVIPQVILSSIGFVCIISWLNQKKFIVGIYLLVIFVVWQFARYEHMYLVHMAKEYPYSSQYGVKELVTYINENYNKYTNIIITDRYDQPYILYLFYSKYDPQTFQKEHTLTTRDGYGFSTVRDFDKFKFLSIKYDEMRPQYPNSLLVGTPGEIPDEANVVKSIYGTNNYHYFDIVAN